MKRYAQWGALIVLFTLGFFSAMVAMGDEDPTAKFSAVMIVRLLAAGVAVACYLIGRRLARLGWLPTDFLAEKAAEATQEIRQETSVLTINGVAQLTGLSTATIYRLTSQKEIPHYKRGNKLYFRKSEIEAWLVGNKVFTNAEIDSLAANYVSLNKR